MLVLTRKAGEQIIINGNIRISIVSVGPGRVKIGIDAPADVRIDREEIYAKKLDEALPAPAMHPVKPNPKPTMPAPPVTPGVVHNRIAEKLNPKSAPVARRKAR